MPSLRKRVAGFMRQLSVSNLAAAVENIGHGESSPRSPRSAPQDLEGGCFITRYLNGLEIKTEGPAILHGRNPEELPSYPLCSLDDTEEVFAALTGPDLGLTTVNVKQRHLSISDPDVDYIDILEQSEHERAGPKASIAARAAVHGSIEYLNKALFSPATDSGVTTTRDVFVALLRSFHSAHSLILQEQGMLTTLTVCAVLPLAPANSALGSSRRKYVACTCNVGDSLAYVYSRQTGVREITQGSHDIHCMRDMRDALGALGPVDGCNPELNNLTLSMTEVERGDIVFLTSDGISDNFDPVVGKFAVLPTNDTPNSDKNVKHDSHGRTRTRRKSTENLRRSDSISGNNVGLPIVEAYQRHELTLLRMEDLLKRGVSGEGPPCNNARRLCELLLDFAVRITAAKRRILEDPDLYYSQQKDGRMVQLSKLEQRNRRKKMLDKISMVPGKLDHATVVAYTVGQYTGSQPGL
ncbi:PP2C-like domain-containing protein CG9801 isoform X7 [Athalia rosae]|uniref:PP2C-like domain-containing protein CG9801 isoform X7 n=1 Tax=Athalia rosae TaxID=37344 RepID=UPI002034873B|nr:PP2C-like domain-containing protein CG9801 isoform X7 [Athalia rosae]